MSPPLLYKSLTSILDVLEKPEHKTNKCVQELLNIYCTTKTKLEKLKTVKKHPLIILEGLDGSGKSTVSSRFAKKINGIKWQTPPKSISHLRSSLDDDKHLRTAYYSLGNYIAGLEVQMYLQDTPVIIDRYWHSTASYAIAQAVQDHPEEYKMPPKGDRIYEWPKDLFKPDLILLLDVQENIRLQRLSSRKEFTTQEMLLQTCPEFRENVLLAYKNMFNPKITVVNGNLGFKNVMEELSLIVNPLLSVKT